MAHSKLNRTKMLDWIERCLAQAAGTPTDREIVEHFGFASTEQARTLLAELADAGKITIAGYGDTRRITLGRAKSAHVRISRPEPTVAHEDPVVTAGFEKIKAIITRGAKPAPASVIPPDGAKIAWSDPAPADTQMASILTAHPVVIGADMASPASIWAEHRRVVDDFVASLFERIAAAQAVDHTDQIAALTARAEAAETKLAALRELIR